MVTVEDIIEDFDNIAKNPIIENLYKNRLYGWGHSQLCIFDMIFKWLDRIGKKDYLLEIGCGIGILAENISDKYPNYIAFDILQTRISKASNFWLGFCNRVAKS